MSSYSDDLQIKEELKKYIPVIFQSVDNKIHYAFVCKKTDIFNITENKLYQKYPEYKDSENYFTIGGRKINKCRTFEENNVKYSDIILLNKYDLE